MTEERSLDITKEELEETRLKMRLKQKKSQTQLAFRASEDLDF
jgi:hypothetical protein